MTSSKRGGRCVESAEIANVLRRRIEVVGGGWILWLWHSRVKGVPHHCDNDTISGFKNTPSVIHNTGISIGTVMSRLSRARHHAAQLYRLTSTGGCH
jgi:hypothetical protein